MAYRIVLTNFTTKALDVELHNANNYDSIIEVYYVGRSHINHGWHGVIANATKNDDDFDIIIDSLKTDDIQNGYSVQGLLDEMDKEDLPVKILFNNDEIVDNITKFEFVSNDIETTLNLL